MKKSPEPTRANNLPAFLDSPSLGNAGENPGDTQVDLAEPEVDQAEASPAVEATTEPATAGPATDDAGSEASPPPPASRRHREQATAAPARAGGTLATTLGVLALVGAPLCGLAPAVSQYLAQYGCTPNLLFVLGGLLVATGMTQRHIARLQHRLDEGETRRRQDADAVHQNLQLLVDDSQREKAPAQGEELQHVLLTLQRQDEKINNLTKAIKMYGKPLMEMSDQGTEVTTTLATVKSLVEGGTESARQSINRLEAQLRSATTGKDLGQIQASLQQITERVDALAKKVQPVSMEPLQQQLSRLEVTLAAVSQRLEDSEVRKSLLRLEEAMQKGREATQELLRGESLRAATTQLQGRIDSATKGLADGLAQLRDGNLGGLETSVRDIQREVSGVATTVAQINAAVKTGARVAVAPAPVAAPAPAAATPVAAGVASTAPAAPSPAAPGAPAAEPTTGYATGTRTSGGKNVLGAIAKLKQMKG